MVGKWHVGHGYSWMTPWRRGFQTFSGYLAGTQFYSPYFQFLSFLAGAEDHYTREWCMEGTDWCGVDYAEHNHGFTGATNSTWGEYSGDLYLRKMRQVVQVRVPNILAAYIVLLTLFKTI